MKLFIIFSLLLSLTLQAEVLKRNEAGDFVLTRRVFKTSELLTDYGRLLGLNMTIGRSNHDESFEAEGELVVPKDQIESYVSTILLFGGRAMIRQPGSQFVKVIESRDIRYASVPLFKEIEKLPDNDNHAQFSHDLKHINGSEVARNLRPFLSRYGRLIDMKDTVFVADSGKNIKRIAQIIKTIDTEEYKKSKEEMEEINEKHKKILVTEKTFLEILNQNQIIFIFVFFLFGSIMGFGIRGFMMKKIEGGW